MSGGILWRQDRIPSALLLAAERRSVGRRGRRKRIVNLGVSRIILFAKDMEKMSTFYEVIIGLRRVETPDDSDDFVVLDAGGVRLCLHRIPEQYARDIEISSPPVAREGTPLKICFHSSNVRHARGVLESRGAMLGPVREFGSLHLCDGTDPEGNVFQLSNRR